MKLFQSLLLPYALYCRVAQRLPVHSRLDSRLLLSTSTNLKKSPVARAPVILNDEDIEESFVKGSGPGGQKINKRSNRVRLVHKPTGTTVSCQDFRDLTSNRKHARTLLKDKLDALINGENSKLAKKIEKIRKRKAKSRSRSAKKYGTGEGDPKKDPDSDKKDDSDSEDVDDDDDDDDDEEEEERDRRPGRREEDPDRKDYYHQPTV